MALIKTILGKTPQIHSSVYLSENATIIGDTVIGQNSSIWFNTVIRADVNKIIIGKNTNIQDGSIVHCTYNRNPTIIGDNVNIGHNAIVHGCTINNNILIGMGSIIMDNVIVEDYCIIAAGSVVTENTYCESGYLYAGVPAKKIKQISQDQRKMLDELSHKYIKYSEYYK